MESNVHLLVSGPRRKRSIAAVSSFIEAHAGYILEVDEHLNPPESGRWFMRIEIRGQGFGLSREGDFTSAFAPVAREYGMEWRVSYVDRPKRMAIMSQGTSIVCWTCCGAGTPVSC